MSGIFANPLTELIEYEELSRDLKQKKGPLQLSGCMDSQKVHLMSETATDMPWKLVVTSDESHAKEIYEDFRCFRPDVWLYPAKDLLFYSADIHGNLISRERLVALRHRMEDETGVFVTTIDGLMDRLLPMDRFYEEVLHAKSGMELDLEAWKESLARMGYERLPQVDGVGQFSVRGDILDIFPMTQDQPVRIELWDNEIDLIRLFDLESQRSVEQLDQVDIYPAVEFASVWEQDGMSAEKPEQKRERETVSLLDYFAPGTSMIFLDEPVRLRERGEAVEEEFAESMKNRQEEGYALPAQMQLLIPAKEILTRCARPDTLCLTGLDQNIPEIGITKRYSIQGKSVSSYQNSFELLISDLTRWKKNNYRVVLLSGSHTRASRLANDLREYGLSAFCPDEGDIRVQPGQILVTYGNLHRGFEYPQIRFVVITETDMFGGRRKKNRRRKKKRDGSQIQGFTELSVGDYVIHEDHGLGIYRGIEKIERDRALRDYLKIEYADGGYLYLPATKLEVIQKYSGAETDKKRTLDPLGGTQWKKTRKKVKSAVQEIAKDLVELYAARQQTDGFPYGPDTVWQTEFEELFPFEETEDQLVAIEDTKRDMESTRIMDRLICGDVGYGKTEIALRAAFKAVQESKQVVYLVPTTILAQQHYNTFVQRMKDFPVRVALMSRFRSSAEIRRTVEDLQKGLVDIVIGTHRVLSKDVKFKDLGLLIIDEEQRFGVTHKEKIKKLKENVDVLTLTATPIPRTLHMSLVGIRDMSVLEEPPVDRVPIQTYVMEYHDEMVREAIDRELARGGQVYFVYNRVKDIEEMASRVQALVPEATVVYAHGQMREHDLEEIMLDFVNGEIDVLVSTTIIETGLDIPNVNTIIIYDADRMGLSQLYQLRGRVGRSSRTAYAFLMYRKDKILKEEAEKRLRAIREFTELGSGIRIAMRDLEIRGAGNVLGAEQSGHMEAVGYDLYCKMLNQAVQELKGTRRKEEDFQTEVTCDIDAYLPGHYIKNEYQKLDVYKRIASIENQEEVLDMEDELIDRFGEIPRPAGNLLTVAAIRTAAHHAWVTEVRINRQEVRLLMHPQASLDVTGIPALMERFGRNMRYVAGENPYFQYVDKKTKYRDCTEMMSVAQKFLTELGKLAV
ncbi:MAG: transcription-repair coupling factor [Clostridiales bacterium]|nr:transcription-repair coupling factor [Clostridiales bacterium]